METTSNDMNIDSNDDDDDENDNDEDDDDEDDDKERQKSGGQHLAQLDYSHSSAIVFRLFLLPPPSICHVKKKEKEKS